MAKSHYVKSVQKKCMTEWKLFVEQVHRKREIKQSHQQTKSRMAAFLEMASKKMEQYSDEESSEDEQHVTSEVVNICSFLESF